MKLVVISDTHGQHSICKSIPDGDVLIHCGDFTNVGEHEQVEDFIRWFAGHPHKFKIFIAGNHDRSFDVKFPRSNRDNEWLKDVHTRIQDFGLHYLENSSVDILGVKFWGSPMTPDFYPEMWAFNCPRGAKINEYWRMIPSDTDVVITHGPPEFKLDTVVDRNGFAQRFVGCADLRFIIEEIRPKYHLFGHIHEGYGINKTITTTYVNASLLDKYYRPVNEPIIVEL